MLQLFQRLMPSEHQFFSLFQKHASVLTRESEALNAMLAGGPGMARHCAEVMRLEEEADEVTRDVLHAVRSTFITPFDRSDIQALITAMDDAADQMQKTAKAIVLFELEQFEPEMQAMGRALAEGAELVERAVPLLSKISRNAGQLNEICVQITRIEGEADDTYDRGLKALYARTRAANAPMDFVRGNEVYDHLEKAVDRFDDIANKIQAVVIEHV
jgi:predicted phosphate transport protein (TIGR00153 family)